MATFLTATDSSAAIERVIREASASLTLISAFVFPRIVHLQRLQDAGESGVEITILFGKKPMDKGVFRDLRELPNMRLYFLKELHAKCYFNELEGVVTSLNLLGGSERNNREMGVLLRANEDAEAYAAMCKEARSIIRIADLIHSTVPDRELEVPRKEWGERARSITTTLDAEGDALSDIEKLRREHPRAYLRWTPEEDALILEMLDKGMARLAISEVLQRQPSAIVSRIRRLRP
ncbi:MAG: hypothetical protein H6597_03275 [Flavobacteriales bacterium]|nr:hypothetical protein [Flavobacteriales bacterium]MCB9193528.1 hypothetical protein [Flavobacteriales bacterium]